MSVLAVKNLSKTYSAGRLRKKNVVNAVDSVSFRLSPGEKIGIIGESGCGKTTLLKMILGLTTPTSGDIEVCSAAGFVAQDPYCSLCHALTVAEIIAEPLIFTKKYRRASQCISEVKQVMSLVNLDYDKYAPRYPHQLSGGERQRVSIARAMVMNPGFLVLDEPTSMIDFEVKSNIVEVINHIAKATGTALLLVTHDIAAAREMCDKLLVMNAGKIIEDGLTKDIMQNPCHEYTKKLILASCDIEKYWEISGAGLALSTSQHRQKLPGGGY